MKQRDSYHRKRRAAQLHIRQKERWAAIIGEYGYHDMPYRLATCLEAIKRIGRPCHRKDIAEQVRRISKEWGLPCRANQMNVLPYLTQLKKRGHIQKVGADNKKALYSVIEVADGQKTPV